MVTLKTMLYLFMNLISLVFPSSSATSSYHFDPCLFLSGPSYILASLSVLWLYSRWGCD